MYLTDPSLYGVTYPQREIGTTLLGTLPVPWQGALPVPWQNVQRFLPPSYPYGPYGMQPSYPFAQFGAQPFYPYGMQQPFLPQNLGYPTPFQTAPVLPTGFNPLLCGGVCNAPFNPPMHGWQRPMWY